MNQFINTFKQTIPNISIRVDVKQLIAELRACQNNYVYLDINTDNLSTLIIRDNQTYKIIRTKN